VGCNGRFVYPTLCRDWHIMERNQQFAVPILRFVVLLTALVLSGASQAVPADPPAEAPPVILLTGFEPFGAKRLPNPSWEAIRELNGTEWNEYRLVAAELPVIWGKPMQELQRLRAEHRPVAVFSFGQGAPGAFAIETVADNLRGEIPDNAGELPVEPLIVGDGPAHYNSAFPFQAVADSLRKRGFPVRVSEEAGNYLCEETLYSLEHLCHGKNRLEVAGFCHVPPAGTQLIDGRTADIPLIRTFVLEYLRAWRSAKLAIKGKVVPVLLPYQPQDEKDRKTATDREREVINDLIVEYFRSWSEQRMDDYGDLFSAGAVIQEVGSGKVITQLKDPFIRTQTSYHQTALFKAVEVPVRTVINFEANLARVVVYWKLTAGPNRKYGYDHFTLMKQSGNWKIINLVFYGVPEE
jgi:pyroglutamyl-peptidase